MPQDLDGDEIGAPHLCPYCTERIRRATEHGHVDPDWAQRAAHDLANQCPACRSRT